MSHERHERRASTGRAPAVEDGGDDDAERVPADSRTEYCRACGRETEHDVAFAMLSTATDRPDAEHRKFAQCPGHVLTCAECGAETRSPVNR